MTLPYNRRLFRFGVVSETTPGTQGTITQASCALRVMNPMIRPIGQAALIPAGSGLADIGAVNGAYSGALSFDMELYNNGSIWPGRILPAVGFVNNGAAGQYQLCDVLPSGGTGQSWNTISAALYFNSSGSTLTYGIYGAMGTLALQLTAGMPIVGSFRFAGAYTSSPTAQPAAPTYESTLPPVINSFTIDGTATYSIPGMTIQSDNYVELIPVANTSGCVAYAWLRKPSFRVRMAPLQDAADWVSDWLTSGTHSFTAVAGTIAGNIITVSGTLTQSPSPDKGDRDENLVTPLEFAVLNNSLKIAFT